MAINKCTVTATIKDLAGAAPTGINSTLDAKFYVKNDRSFAHGDSIIAPFEISANFNSSGIATLDVIETETPGEKLEFFITYYEGRSLRTIMFNPVVVPDDASIDLAELTLPKASSF